MHETLTLRFRESSTKIEKWCTNSINATHISCVQQLARFGAGIKIVQSIWFPIEMYHTSLLLAKNRSSVRAHAEEHLNFDWTVADIVKNDGKVQATNRKNVGCYLSHDYFFFCCSCAAVAVALRWMEKAFLNIHSNTFQGTHVWSKQKKKSKSFHSKIVCFVQTKPFVRIYQWALFFSTCTKAKNRT